MTNISRVLYEGFGYQACLVSKGTILIVTRGNKGGKALTGEQVPEWVEAIETAMDNKERAELCRAIYQS